MAGSTAAKLKEAAAEALSRRTVTKAAVKELDITSNPVAKVALDPSIKPEEKVKTIAGSLSPETAEQASVALKNVEEFREYLAQRRAAMQRKLIELSSTTVFAKLQKTITGMQQGVVDFDNMMRPMTDDLQNIFVLRTSGQMNAAYAQISQDREKEAEWAQRTKDIDTTTKNVTDQINVIQGEIESLKLQKGWFGGIKSSALAEIALKQSQMAALSAQLEEQSNLVQALAKEQAEYNSKSDEYKEQRQALRKMLDISGPEYVKKMEGMIQKALDFIDVSKEDIGELREELTDLDDQAAQLLRVNSQMTLVTAILDKSLDTANEMNVSKVQALAVAPENEDTLGKVTREQRKNDIERFISSMKGTAISVKGTISELNKDAVTANNFSGVVNQQTLNMRELHSEGIASIATSLNTSIQAFNAAALNEAGENARQAMRDMNTVTDKIRDHEVIRSAMTLEDSEKRVIEKIESLSSVAEALETANQLRAQGMSSLNQRLADLKDVSDNAMKQLQTSIGMDAQASETPSEPTKKSATNNDGLSLF